MNSTKENKKIEFPTYLNNLTCDNKRKGQEHFNFDVNNMTT